MGRGRRMRSLLLTAAIAVMCSIPVAAAASGNDDNYFPTPTAEVNDTTLLASVELLTGSGAVVATYVPSGGGGGPVWACYYFHPASPEGAGLLGPDLSLGPVWPPVAGDAYFLYCYEGGTWETGAYASGLLTTFDPANPLGPIGAAERARDLALDQVDLPTPTLTTAPPVDRDHLVGLASWFWTPTWSAQTATATLAGVTATVTATPVRSAWDPGDGTGTIACEGPGEPWHADATGPPPCGHTYQRSGTYPLTATITWDVAWTSTDPATPGGPLGSLTTTATVPVVVRQAQAVIT